MSKRTTILALILAGFMSLGLFMISYQVHDLEDQLDGLNRDISRDSRAKPSTVEASHCPITQGKAKAGLNGEIAVDSSAWLT